MMKVASYNPDAKDSNFLSLAEINKPSLNAGDGAIIRVRGCGVCGSDLLKLDRKLVKAGTILGHEMVGEILEIPDALSQKYNLKTGDRIISSHHVPCGNCNYCFNGQESLCKQFKATNFEPGAFCEYLKLSEDHLAKTVLTIPDNLSDQEASFTEPVACCIKAVKRSQIAKYQGNQKTIVIGLGSIGQIIGQTIKSYQNPKFDNQLIGCDLLDSKLELAQANGFDQVSKTLDNEKADFIFLASGANATIDLALKNIKDGGTIVVFSSVPDTNIAFKNNDIYFRELTIISSYSPNLEDLREAMDLLAKGQIKAKELITHTASLETLGKTIVQCQEEQGTKVYLNLL